MKLKITPLRIGGILLLILLFTTSIEAQNERTLKEVFGTVTHKNFPLEDVNIQVKYTQRGTKTDSKGKYTMNVSQGEELEFTYVGFETVSIVIEDVTDRLDIAMFEMENVLDEAVVTAVSKSSKLLPPEERELKLSIGTFRLEELGSVDYLDKSKVPINALTLGHGLAPYFFGSGGRIIWELDGIPFIYEPAIAPGVIEEIYIVRDAPMARYGYFGRGNIVIVRTFDALRREAMAARKVTDLRSNKFYENNSVDYRDNWSTHSSFFNALKSTGTVDLMYAQYTEQKDKSFDFHLDAANFFYQEFPETTYAKMILTALAKRHAEHPEILKAIAYYLERQSDQKEAREVYATLAQLRPNYAQSYRDLANAYREEGAYTRAWRTYMYSMLREKLTLDSGVGDLVYNEMEWLYYRKSEETDIKERFLPRESMMTPFENDVRLVFEWNTSEAEFELEFVNPESRSYSFTHTLQENKALITEEKLLGYSSKEFLQEQILEGDWAVYISYFGNKKKSPTILKMTKYYNWGKTNEHRVVEVFRLEGTLPKVKLTSMNRRQLSQVDE